MRRYNPDGAGHDGSDTAAPFQGPFRQKLIDVVNPNTSALGLAPVPPGVITYWMLGRNRDAVHGRNV